MAAGFEDTLPTRLRLKQVIPSANKWKGGKGLRSNLPTIVILL